MECFTNLINWAIDNFESGNTNKFKLFTKNTIIIAKPNTIQIKTISYKNFKVHLLTKGGKGQC
jgi:hypothetical protein